MEISALPNRVFKLTVMKMFLKVRRAMHEQRKIFKQKDIKC